MTPERISRNHLEAIAPTLLTYSVISKTVGLSPNTVKSFCRRENIIVAPEPNNADSDICKTCGKPLKHHQGKKKSYCSYKCRSDWWNHKRRWLSHRKVYHLICLHCGTEFKSYGNKQRKYCGRDCFVHSRYGEGLP